MKSWFSEIAKKFADKLDISGEGIITVEDVKRAQREEQEKAMDAYLDDPSEENKAELKRLKISDARLEAYTNGEEFNTDIRLRDIIRSPSHIADKNAVFRPFYEMGEKSMKKLVRLRDYFSRHYAKAYDLVKDKEDKEHLAEIILTGDMEGKEFTKQELLDDGVKENVAEAYKQIRQQLNRAYTLIDDARRHPNKHAQHLSDRDIEKLRQNKFVKHLHVTKDKDANGKSLVVWTEYQNEQKEYTVDAATLEQFKKNAAIQILSEQKIGDEKYKVKVLEGKAPLTKIGGSVKWIV